MDQSTAVAVIPEEERDFRGLELAEQHYPIERRREIAQFLDIPADSPALLPYLALCASLRLSPVMGHLWLIPKKHAAKDGEPERYTYRPAIGRDGLLHKARESKSQKGGYRGMSFGVVCAHDTFEVEYSGDIVNDPKILHRYAGKPTEFPEGVEPGRWRGKVIGAWAKAFIDGEPPVFYFATVAEHARLKHVWAWNPNAGSRKPLYRNAKGITFEEFSEQNGINVRNAPVQEFEGAWDYLSTMILKAAQSYVLRIGLGVTGVIPVDEMRGGEDEPTPAEGVTVAPLPMVFDIESVLPDVDPELREQLARAIETANSQEEFAWAPAKCEMTMRGRSEDELRAVLERIESENEIRERRLAGEPEVVDAEIVGEGEPAAETPPAEDHTDRIAELRDLLPDLRASHEAAEGDEKATLGAELDQVVAELKSLGVDPA